MEPLEHHESPSMLYAVKRLELAIRSHLDTMLAGAEVTTLQYTALTVLERHDAMTAAELARRSFVTPQAMADMTCALEATGLIERRVNPLNRRERLIRLTTRGHDVLAEYASSAEDITTAMVSRFEDDEIPRFRALLTQAWASLAETRPRAHP